MDKVKDAFGPARRMIYRFLDFELDASLKELRQAGEPRAIEPQVYDLLLHLIENRDRVVSHDELIENVWRGRIVADATIASRIRAVRAALGDTGADQTIIQTLPKRGFRFVSTVDDPQEGTPEASAENGPAAKTAKPSIIVLPFSDQSTGPDQGFLADGLTEDITTLLSQHQWLFVIARSTAETFNNSEWSAEEIGREIGVAYVLEGSVRRAGDRVRISAQLIESASHSVVWAERFDRVLTDIFDLQDEIAASISGVIEPSLLRAERERLERSRPVNFSAWEAIARATPLLWIWTSERTSALPLLQEALRLDPSYARAFSLLALFHAIAAWQGSARDTVEASVEAIAEAQRALEIDGRDPWAHLALGIAFGVRRRRDPALRALDMAIKINPNFAVAHAFRGIVLAWANRVGESLDALDLAERLSPRDPFNRSIMALRATALFIGCRYEDAVAVARESVNLAPGASGPQRVLAASCAMAGLDQEARAAMAKTLELLPTLSARWMREHMPISDPEALERYVQAMISAGLPE